LKIEKFGKNEGRKGKDKAGRRIKIQLFIRKMR